MTNQRNFMLEEAPIHFDNTNADCWVKGADYGYQAAQADQADEIKRLEIQNALYVDDELVLLADRDLFINEIRRLQLDNAKLREALVKVKDVFLTGFGTPQQRIDKCLGILSLSTT
jgi:hypothetical protein